MSAEYKTEQVELKYIEFKTPWNIFEKHRGKRVFNVPNDLSVCIDNPSLVLESELTAAQAEIEVLKAKLEKCKEQRDIAIKGWFNSSDYRNGFAAARKIDESNKELDSIGSEK